jgi:hypothetical protein
MNLIQIKEYFKSVPMATIIDAATYFKTKPIDIQCYIEHWEYKGQLKKCMSKKQCGSCNLCNFNLSQYYKWQF